MAFRMAAFSLTKSKNALGAFCKRKRSQLGAPEAFTAITHKIVCLVCSMLKYGTEYVDQGQDYYEKNIVNELSKIYIKEQTV